MYIYIAIVRQAVKIGQSTVPSLDTDISLNPFATEFVGLVVRNYFLCQF